MMSVVLSIIVFLLIAFAICVLLIKRHYAKLLDKATKRAQKSERMKSVFIDNISRSLRAPLDAIAGSCNSILKEKDENMHSAEMRKIVANMAKSLEDVTDFVSQLHEMSKFEGITPSFTFIEVNLSELMASYRRETLNYTKPDVAVRVSTDLSPHCRGILDTNLMHQLMMHLLTYAAGRVTQGDIYIKYSCERRGLRVSISFSGVHESNPADADDVYSILQKDDALKNAIKSSTLGFAICKAIIDMFGGELFMDTDADKKSVASFWFPCTMKDIYKDI